MDDSYIFFAGLGIFMVVITAIILTMVTTFKLASKEAEANRISENKSSNKKL